MPKPRNLLDLVNLRIVAYFETPSTAREAAKALGIPPATMYHRVKDLIRSHFLVIQRPRGWGLSVDAVYRSNVKQIEVELRKGTFSTRIELKDGEVREERIEA